MIGLRAAFAYKPEGFTEPEGELEAQLVLVRPIGRGAARAMIAYGQDPEGNEFDGEVAASYVHRIAEPIVIGATARYRYGFAVKRVPGFTSSHFVDNGASANVLRKLGFEPTGRGIIVCAARGHEVEAVTYWLTAQPVPVAQPVKTEAPAAGLWRTLLARLAGRPA